MSYDYTATDFVDSPDDFLIGNVANVADKSIDEMEKDNRFLSIPPGEHVLEVIGFMSAPKQLYKKVFLTGQLTGFDAFTVAVKFGMIGNSKATISDNFVLPPSDPNALRAYFYGVPEDSQTPGSPSKMAAGILANRFRNFIERLGYPWPVGSNFPVEAQRLGSWKGRRIACTVVAGKGTWTNKDGVAVPRDNSIKWFSYKPAPAGAGTGAANAGLPGGQTAATSAVNGSAPTVSPAVNAARAGLGVI